MKIIIIDDDALVSGALKTIVEASGEINVLAIGKSGEEAVDLYEKFSPDIVLMDIRMGAVSGIDAGKQILQKHPCAKILFLTTFSDGEYIAGALKIGAKGYILKQHYENIVPALKAVMQGHNVFGDEIVSKLSLVLGNSQDKKNPSEFGISDKELEIIKLVAGGLSNKEIASNLFLSEGTVRNYISVILEKLCLRDRTQLAVFYYNNLT